MFMVYVLKIGQPDYITAKSPDKVALALTQNQIIGLDIETGYSETVPYKKVKSPDGGFTQTIDYSGLSPETGKICVISIYLPSVGVTVTLTGDEINQGPVLDALLAHIIDPSKVTVAHNLLYEGDWFLAKYGVTILNGFCTQVAHQVQTAGLAFMLTRAYGSANTLSTLTKRLLGVSISKAEQSSDWSGELTRSQLVYSMLDPYWTYRCYLKLRSILDTQAGSAEMGALPVFIELNRFGIPADIDKLTELEMGYSNASVSYHTRIMELANSIIQSNPSLRDKLIPKSCPKSKRESWQLNLNSPKQVKELINYCQELEDKLPISSTSAAVLETLNTPIALALTRYRTMIKLVQYASKFKSNYNPKTKRVTCQFSVLATQATGRSSAKNGSLQIVSNTTPLMAEHGLSGLKTAFTASVLGDNMVMLKADFAASHLAIARSLSGDELLEHCALNGLKVHYFTLEKILQLEGNPLSFNELKRIIESKDKSHPRYYELTSKYTLAKNVIYSFLNFSGSKTLQQTFAKKGVHISIDDCKLYLNACKETYKQLWDYMRLNARNAEQGLCKTFDTPSCDIEARTLTIIYGMELQPIKPVFLGITTERKIPDGRVIKLPAIRKKQEDSVMAFYGQDAPDIWTSHAAQYVSVGWLSIEATILKSSAIEIFHAFRQNPHWKAQICGFAHDELPVLCDRAYYQEVADLVSSTFERHFRRFDPIYVGDKIEMLSDWETVVKC